MGWHPHSIRSGVPPSPGTSQKGGIRCGHNTKGGGGVFGTGLVKRRGSQELKFNSAHKGVRGFLGAYLLIIFTFTYQHDQAVVVFPGRLKGGGGGIGCGHNPKQRGS